MIVPSIPSRGGSLTAIRSERPSTPRAVPAVTVLPVERPADRWGRCTGHAASIRSPAPS